MGSLGHVARPTDVCVRLRDRAAILEISHRRQRHQARHCSGLSRNGYIDADTKMVTKVTLDPYNLPADFPIRNVKVSLDYDLANIGDGKYMLPLKAELTSRVDRYATKNDIEFRLYRKFETGSTIKFDTPDPLPEDETKDKPVEEKIKKP